MSGIPEIGHTAQTVRGQAGTESFGRDLAAILRPGDLVLLTGEVGAGKSTLVRAALRELGVSGAIPSPTFTIGRFYDAPEQTLPAAHLDLYRLGDLADEDPGLLAEYFGPDRVTFVEWPGGATEELAEMSTRVIRVDIQHVDQESRRVKVD